MELDRAALDLLRPAADHLREVLRRMDPDVIPARLRAFASSSDRRIPPPMLKRAVSELDASAWLRDEVASEFELDEDSAEGLYVLRPSGWEQRLERLIQGARLDATGEELEELRKELKLERERIAELEAELRTADSEVAVAEVKAHRRLLAQVEVAERGRRDAERREREESRRAMRLEAESERLSDELAALTARVESLRQMLERERRVPTVVETAAGGGSFPSDPLEMADELDRIFRQVGRPPLLKAGAHPEREVERLPAGVRPDRMEIIHWLLQRPLTWLIDGYNLAFQVAAEPDGVTRARLEAAARMIGSLGATGTMVVIVFDSAVEPGASSSRGVSLVYTRSADDWIAEHARPGTVVVSSDREVRERAEESGSITVWSEALAEWIRAGYPVA